MKRLFCELLFGFFLNFAIVKGNVGLGTCGIFMVSYSSTFCLEFSIVYLCMNRGVEARGKGLGRLSLSKAF